MERNINVGAYKLGHVSVELVAATGNGTGGEFYLCPGPGEPPRIRIFIEYDQWASVVATLFHECFEMATCMQSLRFQRSGKLNGDHADYLFVFDHSEFGNICSMVGGFITEALPDLAEIYNRKHRKRV